LIVETYLYMVFISLGAFLRRYYCKMVFWAILGPKKVFVGSYLPTNFISIHENGTNVS